MKTLLLALSVVTIATGCASAPVVLHRLASASPEIRAGRPRERSSESKVTILLSSDPVTEGRVLAEVRVEGAAAMVSAFAFRPAHGTRVEAVTARDANGEVKVELGADDGETTLTIASHERGLLDLHYAVVVGGSTDPLAPIAEPTELRGSGEDLLALPVVDGSFPTEIKLGTGGGNARAASSFGLGNEVHGAFRMEELRAGYFLAGDVGSAAFHAVDGDDFAGWVGFTSFDPRWVSAETAGVRSAVDDFVDRAPGTGAQPVSLLFSSRKRSDPSLAIVRRARGLLVSTDPGALWSAPSRIQIAQALVQRYVGGLLWVGDRNHETSGYFFSEGFSRSIAARVLSDIGTIDHADRAAEVNTLLAEIELSPLGRAPIDALSRGGESTARVLAARGALLATLLDRGDLRASGSAPRTNGALKPFVRHLFQQALVEKADTLTLDGFFAVMRRDFGDARMAELEASLVQGTELALPSDLLGPCYRLKERPIAPFQLGFAVRGEGELSVAAVEVGSRAEAAGLRLGDVVRDLRYQEGRSDIEVSVVVVRDSKPKKLHFFPAGPAKPGRMFERIREVSDQHC